MTNWTQHILEQVSGESVLHHHLHGLLRELSILPAKQRQRFGIAAEQLLEIQSTLGGLETGAYYEGQIQQRPFYRAVLWNLKDAPNYDGVLGALKEHPILAQADVYILLNSDVGLVRSGNRNVPRSLALELGLNFVFAPTGLHLPASVEKNDLLGLQGHAILSRHPIANVRTLLDPSKFSQRGDLDVLSSRKILAADLCLHDNRRVTVGALALPATESARARSRRLKNWLKVSSTDWTDQSLLAMALNTITFDAGSRTRFLMSAVDRVLRGTDYIWDDHQPFPERSFEKKVFCALCELGWNWSDVNDIGKMTWCCRLAEIYPGHSSERLLQLIHLFFGERAENLHLKVDWFAARSGIKTCAQIVSERAKVLANPHHEGLSDRHHRPVVLDFELEPLSP